MKIRSNSLAAAALLWLAALPLTGFAASGGEAVEGPQYVDLKPSFIANYGGPGPIHFLKADIALRVGDAASAAKVNHHMPQLRHHVVMLLSSLSEQDVASMEGREALRQQALVALQEMFQREEGGPVVDDLLFNGFVLQR